MNGSLEFGKKLRSARQRAGNTISEIADRYGLQESTVQKWETGQRLPKPDMIFTLEKDFGFKFGDLLSLTKHAYLLDKMISSESVPHGSEYKIEGALPTIVIDVYRLAEEQDSQDTIAGEPRVVTDGGRPVGKIERQIAVVTRVADSTSFGIIVPDDAMEPRILLESIAIITPSASLDSGHFCFAMLIGGKQLLRRYREVGKNTVLEPLNDKHEVIVLNENESEKSIFYRLKAVLTEY